MNQKLQFHWRRGDFELRACPKHLARLEPDEENVTIDFIKWFRDEESEKEHCCSIGYFYYNEHDEMWELKFVGNRFKNIPDEESPEVWKQLKIAYDVLNDWLGTDFSKSESIMDTPM